MDIPPLLIELNARVQKTVDKFHTLLHSVQKEMRQFPVCVSKDLSMLASFDCSIGEPHKGEHEIGNRWYAKLPVLDAEGSAGRILDFVFDGMFKIFDDRRFDHLKHVPVKVTKSVRINTGEDLRSGVVRICEASVRNEGRVLGLLELFSLLGVPKEDLLDQSMYDEFLKEAADMFATFVEIPPITCPTILELFKVKYARRRLLKLQAKVYFARADDRAYVLSSDAVASITGAIVQRLLIPTHDKIYDAIWYSRSVSKRGGNTLDIVRPARYIDTVHLVLLDLMGFTGSNVNSNVLTLVVAHWLAHSDTLSHLREPKLFSVQGEYFEADLLDVFVQYLYRTLLADVELPNGSTFYHVGGYLGISGNMAMCMYACIIELDSVLRQCASRNVRFVLQPGGDDIAILLIGPLEGVVMMEQMIRNRLTKVVGVLKEFNIHDIPVGSDRVTLGEFCKKRTMASRTQLDVTITSVVGLPISRDLLTRKTKRQAHEHVDRFLALCSDTPICSDPLVFEAFLREYERLHGVTIRLSLGVRPSLDGHQGLEKLGNKLLTHTALQVVNQIQGIVWRGVAIRSTGAERINYALCLGLLVRLVFSNAIVYDSVADRALVKANIRNELRREFGPEVDLVAQYVRVTHDSIRELSY